MRSLVTGGAGFIGSNLVDALLARGDDVTVLDDLSTGRRENVSDGADLQQASITDREGLARVVGAAGPEVVFHLGAQIDVRRSVADPAFDVAVNVVGTLNVLEAARDAGVRHVVFASTGGAIYGDADEVPTPETHEARPAAPYGMSKLSAEGYIRLYEELEGLRATSLRFANVYGPRQDPLGEGGVIAIYCGLAVNGGEAVVFGDGRQTRDFTYVGDVVDALMLAAEGAPAGPFNVGTGIETPVIELAERLGLPTRREPARPGEVFRSCLDPRRAARELGWTAKTDLATGLERTLDWARAQAPA
ncbi:MAG: UDP-glucose 4-epimerase [Solirubrobacteraceae bacterium]|jgi:UDP-glucose 4-epimerase|nr:UDP-glucose 4-epimerase [Solirubrobacteraceae bacterium]